MCFDNGEIQHVDDAAVEEVGVAVRWKYLCHVLIGAFLEDKAVEHAIQEVTECTGKNETGANDKTAVVFLFDNGLDIIDTEDDGNEAEQGQRHLTPGAAKLPAPGHPFVLYEIDLRSFAQQFYTAVIRGYGVAIEVCRMTQRHVGLHPYLQRLICHDDQQHY